MALNCFNMDDSKLHLALARFGIHGQARVKGFHWLHSVAYSETLQINDNGNLVTSSLDRTTSALAVGAVVASVQWRRAYWKRWLRAAIFGVSGSLLTACSLPDSLSVDASQHTPDQWQAQVAVGLEASEVEGGSQPADWLAELSDPQLQQLVAEALQNSPEFAAQVAQVEQLEAAWRVDRAARFPALTFRGAGERPEGGATEYSANFGFSWDPDLWGALSARERQADLELAAAQAELERLRDTLAADVAGRWFELQESQWLVKLYQERSETLQKDLETIEAGYRLGLYGALDLYLARNDLSAQLATLAQQQNLLRTAQRGLERVLGRYPSAALKSESALPLLESPPHAQLPAQMVARRPDLQASWFNLLAADEALAAAHRDRFPQFSLTADLGGRSDALKDWLSGGDLAWSFGASLLQPLFDAGRLKALQAQQAARRSQLEQRYLGDLYTAFQEVEQALDQGQTLRQRYQLLVTARDSALQAEQLAFERYQRGLETYTTVLEAKRRSLDAQTRVIALRRELLQNRVTLALAVGGRFQLPDDRTPSSADSE